LTRWANGLKAAVLAKAADAPSDPSLSMDAAMKIAGIPARSLVRAVADRCGLEVRSGRIWLDGVATSLGDVEAAVRALETRLVSRPFAAPSSLELDAEGLGSRHVAAAVRAGRLMRLPDGVVLLPSGPDEALRLLRALPQPFTVSQARQGLDTTRRVVIPLLNYLDSLGWTRRLDSVNREVTR